MRRRSFLRIAVIPSRADGEGPPELEIACMNLITVIHDLRCGPSLALEMTGSIYRFGVDFVAFDGSSRKMVSPSFIRSRRSRAIVSK